MSKMCCMQVILDGSYHAQQLLILVSTHKLVKRWDCKYFIYGGGNARIKKKRRRKTIFTLQVMSTVRETRQVTHSFVEARARRKFKSQILARSLTEQLIQYSHEAYFEKIIIYTVHPMKPKELSN